MFTVRCLAVNCSGTVLYLSWTAYFRDRSPETCHVLLKVLSHGAICSVCYSSFMHAFLAELYLCYLTGNILGSEVWLNLTMDDVQMMCGWHQNVKFLLHVSRHIICSPLANNMSAVTSSAAPWWMTCQPPHHLQPPGEWHVSCHIICSPLANDMSAATSSAAPWRMTCCLQCRLHIAHQLPQFCITPTGFLVVKLLTLCDELRWNGPKW